MNYEGSYMGYNLIQEEKNVWYLQVIGQVAFTGTLREVIVFAVKRLDFDLAELDFALKEMITKDNNFNAAHFGRYKKFIYAFNQDLTPVRKAG